MSSVALGYSSKKHAWNRGNADEGNVDLLEKRKMHDVTLKQEDDEKEQDLEGDEGAFKMKELNDDEDTNGHANKHDTEDDDGFREESAKMKMGLVSQNISTGSHTKKARKKTSDLDSSTDRKTSKRKALNKEKVEKEEMEKKKLESLLFGSLYAAVEYGKEDTVEADELTGGFGPLFFVDKSTGNANDAMLAHEDDMQGNAGNTVQEDRVPAWVDDEEDRAAVNISDENMLRKLRKEANEKVISGREFVSRLRAQHAKLNPVTEWAHIGIRSNKVYVSDDDSADESGLTVAAGYGDNESESILRTNDDLVSKSGTRLLPGLLDYSRQLDANSLERSNGPINSVEFHRNAQLLLTAGLDKRLRFFQIDGKRNTLIQSIFLEELPIHQAGFVPDGSQVIAAGQRRFFYSLDLGKASVDKIGPLTGRDERSLQTFAASPDSKTIAFIGDEGYILLVSSRTKDLIGTLKMNGTARALAFADEGRFLLTSGGDGQVYHWDLRTRRCIHKAVDEGCIRGTSLCTSPDSALFASGSSSGIVNVYRREDFLGGKRKPLKVIENLTTFADVVKFNHDAQILAILSRMKKSSLKLVHVPSFTVFSNFPQSMWSLHYPRCVDFSPGSGFMAVGNAAGTVLLYKLHHYRNA